ncbi:MAG: protochlorophyllide reductase iron-sulfur ATP-binding protein [Methanosaeta sp. PtaU1.Bin028]|nr:MAG: protochlorophyllide reductase iron-sulfur ATP-binding protein [Methanosaeta sp. PtaU1.Bin028]
MKSAIFTGKGGVGKTTILSTLSRLLARDGHRVLVIDCDPSMNLAMSLGVPLSQVKPISDTRSLIQESMEAEEEDDHTRHQTELDLHLEDYIMEARDGVQLVVMGTIPFGGAGCLCTSISLVKMLLGYLSTDAHNQDFILIDSQAGVEIFGRGLAREFDASFVITEPTPKSLEVARQSMKLARDLGVKRQILVVNKVEEDGDRRRASETLGADADAICSVGYDRDVVRADKEGDLVLDRAPQAQLISDVMKLKRCMLET